MDLPGRAFHDDETNDAGTREGAFVFPAGIAISPDSSFAIATDKSGHRVRRLMIATGVVTTLAGNGTAGSADGVGTLASFNSPFGIAISPDVSYALIADQRSNRVRRIVLASDVVTTLAGSSVGYADGVGSSALFSKPMGVAIAPDGTYALITDVGSKRVRRAALASPCSAGYFCPSGSSSATQVACPAGSFCPSASTAGAGLPCPIASFCPMTGMSVGMT